jgi:hypothetical protein
MLCRFLGIGDFVIATMITTALYQFSRFNQGIAITKQSGTGEQNIGHVQPHRTAFGDSPGFIEIVAGAWFIAFHVA